MDTNIPNNNLPQPQANPRPRQGFYWSLLGLIGLAVVSGLLIQMERYKTEQEILSLAAPFPNNLSKMQSNSLKGWQTYSNQKYGFELMYPSAWLADTTYSNKDFEIRGGGDVMGGDTFWQNYEWKF